MYKTLTSSFSTTKENKRKQRIAALESSLRVVITKGDRKGSWEKRSPLSWVSIFSVGETNKQGRLAGAMVSQ